MTYVSGLLSLAALQLFLTVFHGLQIAQAQGLTWGMGRRDAPRSATDFGRRLDRSLANNAENAAVSVPVLILFAALSVDAPLGELLVALYLFCRFAFVGLYLANVPYVRSVVWFSGQLTMAGLVAVLVLALN